MFYVVNLETRKVITYRDGTRMIEAVEQLAVDKAAHCQNLTGHPFTVQHIATPGVSALGREQAPWLRLHLVEA